MSQNRTKYNIKRNAQKKKKKQAELDMYEIYLRDLANEVRWSAKQEQKDNFRFCRIFNMADPTPREAIPNCEKASPN